MQNSRKKWDLKILISKAPGALITQNTVIILKRFHTNVQACFAVA